MSNTFFEECEKFCGKLAVVAGSAVSAQLCPPPKCLQGPPNRDLNAYRGPLIVIYKKVFDVMLHLEAEWP